MKPLKDYSHIRGIHLGRPNGPMPLEKQLEYCQRLNLNSNRHWASYAEWQKDPKGYIASVKQYIRTCNDAGVSTMQILFNGNMMDVAILDEPFWKEVGDPYVRDMVAALKDEPGLLMWDIMNEPSCNDYWRKSPEDEKEARWNKLHAFLKHYCELVKELDPEGTITIGHTYSTELEPSAEWVDVLCFHDYLETRARIEHTYDVAEEMRAKYNKPIINSEMCCLCRANPYDLAIQIATERKVGFYVFCLMADGYWGDVHGLIYPDGTIRNPDAIAALYGFFRNRGASRIAANPNKEGNVYTALELLKEALTDKVVLFENKRSSTDDILEAAEYAANLLEGCEMVPMNNPPTARINDWRAMPEEARPLAEIRAFAYSLAEELKKWCQIL